MAKSIPNRFQMLKPVFFGKMLPCLDEHFFPNLVSSLILFQVPKSACFSSIVSYLSIMAGTRQALMPDPQILMMICQNLKNTCQKRG